MEFEYKLISKGEVAIVSFAGHLSKESRDKMAICQDEVMRSNVTMVVLFFRDVTNIDCNILRELVQIQHEMRKNNLKLFITGLSQSLKQLLDERGVIRGSEVKNSLEEALYQAVAA